MNPLPNRRSQFRDERGAVILWSLGLLLLLFFAGGVALDLWRVLSYHGTLTGIADKAAVAGAAEVDANALYANRLVLVPSRAADTAEDFARTQPEWDVATMTVQVSADTSKVWVELAGTVELTLLQMFAPPQGIMVTVDSQASPTLFE